MGFFFTKIRQKSVRETTAIRQRGEILALHFNPKAQRPSAAPATKVCSVRKLEVPIEVVQFGRAALGLYFLVMARHELLGITDGVKTNIIPASEPRVSPAFLSKYQSLIQGTSGF